MKNFLLSLMMLFATLQITVAQSAYDENAAVAHTYFNHSLKLIKETTGFSPPVASRALGYTGLCLYESAVHGMSNYQSLAGKLPELTDLPLPENGTYKWSLVANTALAYLIDSLYDNMSADNRTILYQIRDGYNVSIATTVPTHVFLRSLTYGEKIGKAIFEYSKTESGYRGQYKNFPASYVPPVGDQYWEPLAGQKALQPYWGKNRPFVTEDTSAANLPQPPPAFSTDTASAFYGFAKEVYDIGLNLTQEQKDIALYWADGGNSVTPPGHSISMLKQLLWETDASLGDAALAYAKMGMSVCDAFIACWKTKYINNLCRPVTYIHQHIDSTWATLIGTPPFPEYPSGHSSQSGAFSVVMASLFGGDDYAFTDSTYAATHGLRSFLSFSGCAEETAVSRLYGGIHYQFGNQNGSLLGQRIGGNINDLFESVLLGTEERTIASVLVYPNPTGGLLTVENTAGLLKSAQVLNLTGSLVMKTAIAGNELDLGYLASGMYLLRFSGENGEVLGQQRVVVQR